MEIKQSNLCCSDFAHGFSGSFHNGHQILLVKKSKNFYTQTAIQEIIEKEEKKHHQIETIILIQLVR